MAIEPISVRDLQIRLSSDTPPFVLDVRTEGEHEIAHIVDALLIPMDEITARIHEVPTDREIVVMCHHGIRSLHVAFWLESQGFTDLYNLSGGIDAWSIEVDSTVPRY